MQENLIIDTDPGMGFTFSDIDDNLAILMALSSNLIKVKLITLVFGNVNLEEGYASLKNFFQVSGHRTPVALGCSKPLFRHSQSGRNLLMRFAKQNNIRLNRLSSLNAEKIDKIERQAGYEILNTIKKTRKTGEKITLITLGPLTNIALAIIIDSQIMSEVEKIVVMGGNFKVGGLASNTPTVEFNFRTDPEAAKIVFDSNIPIVLVPLDVTTKVKIYYEEFEQLLKEKNLLNNFILQSVKNWTEVLKVMFYGDAFFHPHDPVAMGYLLDKSIFKTKKCTVDIETKGEITSGQTLARPPEENKVSVKICRDIDVDRFKQLFFGLL